MTAVSGRHRSREKRSENNDAPSSPNGVDTCPLGDVNDEVDVGVVVVVGAAGNLDEAVSHADVVGVDLSVRWSGGAGRVSPLQREEISLQGTGTNRSSGVAIAVNSTARSSPKVS